LAGKKVVHLSLDAALGALAGGYELHLHALLVEAVLASQLQVEVTLLDEPLANVATFVLGDPALVHLVLLLLHLEIHLLDLLRSEPLCRRYLHYFFF